MWIAKIPFKYQNISGNLVTVKPGDEISDFDNWPYVCKKAHLNLGWVVDEKRPENKNKDYNRGKGHPLRK